MYLRVQLIIIVYHNRCFFAREFAVNYDNYNFTLSNPNFTFNKKTGEITVDVPGGTRYMECDLVATYEQ